MHYLVLLAPIHEAQGDPLDQPDRAIGVPQQQPAAVRTHRAAIECRHHAASVVSRKWWKFEEAA